MSGFAAITGEPDGPPTLPPFGLADGIAALATAQRGHDRAATPATADGRQGQVIDLAIIEPILTLLGTQPMVYDQLGIVQPRTGNRSRQQRAPQHLPHARRQVGGGLDRPRSPSPSGCCGSSGVPR